MNTHTAQQNTTRTHREGGEREILHSVATFLLLPVPWSGSLLQTGVWEANRCVEVIFIKELAPVERVNLPPACQGLHQDVAQMLLCEE